MWLTPNGSLAATNNSIRFQVSSDPSTCFAEIVNATNAYKHGMTVCCYNFLYQCYNHFYTGSVGHLRETPTNLTQINRKKRVI